ncbi:MAG: S-layer homology domain-containing protein [Clostridia bacterium]|nr:S-layer homology domain-containing protein [Clostridia bacterium]
MRKFCILLSCILAFQLFPVFAEQDINKNILFFDDFEAKDESAWTTDSGEVIFIEEEESENIAYSIGSGDYYHKEIMSGLRNYSYSFDMYMDYRDANGQFGNTWPTMRFRVSDNSYYHLYLYNKEGSEEIGFQKMVDGEETWLLTASVPLVEDNEKWVSVKISLTGSKIEIYYKDMETPIMSYDDVNGAAPLGGNFYFVANSASAFYIDNLKVEKTRPVQAEADDITKETGREIYRFYNFEDESENENIKEDENENHYFDANEAALELFECKDFICKFNWIKDYKPYGENNPVFSFGSGYEIELNGSLESGGIVLKKDNEELEKTKLLLADYDDVKTAIIISAAVNQIEVYYSDLNTPVLTYNAEEDITSGTISLSGGNVDNLYLASVYRFKPVEVLSINYEIAEEEMTVNLNAVSHLEEDITASVIVAGYSDDNLCALAVSEQIFKGNDCNLEEKITTQAELLVPYTDDAKYYVYIWNNLKPVADLTELGTEPQRLSMPADSGETSEISLNAESKDGKVEINGLIDTNFEQSITLLVQKSDADVFDIQKAVYITQAVRPDEEGVFKAEFSNMNLDEGDYTVFASSDDSAVITAQFEHIKPENLDLFIEKLNLASTAEELRAILFDATNVRYARKLGINTEKLADLKDDALINGVCIRLLADKGEGFTSENAGKIFASHLGFALLKTAADGNGVYAVISDNPEFYQLDSKYTDAEEKIKKEALNGIYQGLKTNVYNDLKAVMADVGPNVILAEIYTANYKDMLELLEKYQSEIEIDLSKLEDLSETEKANVYKALNENRLYSFDELIKVFDDEIEEQTEEPAAVIRPIGGGGGGGGISVGKKPTSVPSVSPTSTPVAEAMPEQKSEEIRQITYKDLPQEHWANEAVTFLSKQNPPVISGYDDGAFYPDRCITRAEFVKLIINAFKFGTYASECTYKDVANDSWYYNYIAAAEQAGVVTGNDDGAFNPDKEISRQDMAVMLHRVLEIKLISLNTIKEPHFTDKDSVSVYAQKAVETLSAAGVINGTDDGKLNPFASATRAQAAKMIYEILK